MMLLVLDVSLVKLQEYVMLLKFSYHAQPNIEYNNLHTIVFSTLFKASCRFIELDAFDCSFSFSKLIYNLDRQRIYTCSFFRRHVYSKKIFFIKSIQNFYLTINSILHKIFIFNFSHHLSFKIQLK